jgi:cytochrome c peroxidase
MDKVKALVLFIATAISVSAWAATEIVVTQKDKVFSQDSAKLKVGEKIKFVNDDTVTHNLTVKGPSGSSRPGVQEKPGDEIELSFDETGVSEVRCLIHPKMKLSVEAN